MSSNIKAQNGSTEANISNSAAIVVSKNGGKSFRNNVGGAWSGRKVSSYTKNGKQYVVIENGRWITFGLFKGSADRIGWLPVKITKEMVGKTFARFLSLEMKKAKGRISPDQLKWKEVVEKDGGLAGIIRCDKDIDELLK